MGAVLSATELAFGKHEVRSVDTMSPALVRVGVMGGLTMVAMNILGYVHPSTTQLLSHEFVSHSKPFCCKTVLDLVTAAEEIMNSPCLIQQQKRS